MTKKIAISLPDDVAERLSAADIDNVSAYVTEAVRRRMNGEQVREWLAGLGMVVTDEGVQRQRMRRLAHEEQFTKAEWAERFAAAREHIGLPADQAEAEA